MYKTLLLFSYKVSNKHRVKERFHENVHTCIRYKILILIIIYTETLLHGSGTRMQVLGLCGCSEMPMVNIYIWLEGASFY